MEELPKILDPLMAALPIATLVWMMTKKRALPSWEALPVAAVLLYLVKLLYFQCDSTELDASVIAGMLTAYTPIMIVWGAIFLFFTMEATGCMDAVKAILTRTSANKAAQLMIIGWAFGFLIEGASGFGTPAALAAPMLVGLGFDPLKSAVFCLVMNSVPVSFGAVGVPTWFGLSALKLSHEAMLEVGFKTALMHSTAALAVTPIGIGLVLGRQAVWRNLPFIFLSTVSCTLPYAALAYFNYEFPAILGGGIGLLASVWLASKGIGLERPEPTVESPPPIRMKPAAAFFPLWCAMLVLLATRIKQLPLKRLLLDDTPILSLNLGSLGQFEASLALVLKLKHILGTGVAWEQKTLYIPGIIPFLLVSLVAFAVFKPGWASVRSVIAESYGRIKAPSLALFGALAFVSMLMLGGESSCAMIIGGAFAKLAGAGWLYCAPFLGALGAFFAGSNTVSNLTFAGIQSAIAQRLSLDLSTVIALQSAGGAMGNMVCIHNIVAVCSVLGISSACEGKIIKSTIWPLLLYGALAAAVGRLILGVEFHHLAAP